MTAPELAESPAAVGGDTTPPAAIRWLPALIVVALTVVGIVFRVLVADQSIFADELSTYWISATHGLGGVLSLLYGRGRITHAEITPPLSFLLSWLTTRVGQSPELLRLPSLITGAATIPLVYRLGLRTVGRRAALVATALASFSPFMIYYSANARAYALMMFAVVVSTLAMLQALDTGRTRWWVLYAVSACAAFYSHYTCVFVLAGQLLWLLWARPEARRAMLVASAAAAVGVLPWTPGLINDYRSPTLKILSALSPFTAGDIRIDLGHWLIGYPETFAGGLSRLPGTIALILFAVAVAIAAAGLASALRGAPVRAQLAGIDRRVALIIGLALATPVAEFVLGAAGNSVFSVRDLAASWPYLALTGAAALAVLPARAGTFAAGLAVLAFAVGAVKLLSAPFQRPDYQGAASYITQNARPGDVVVDETGALSPGPLTGLDVSLHRRLPIFRAEAPAERDHPFGFLDPIIPLQQGVNAAVAAARGHRVFLVSNVFATDIAGLAARVDPAPSQFPARYRLTAERAYAGIGDTLVAVYADVGAQPK
jgi:4-amino-4-deoxy-L-arabinose transferase-like glycosyltransferase